MIVTTAQLYKVAYAKFAVGAYNINNMEQLLRLFRAMTVALFRAQIPATLIERRYSNS
jgi:fructose-bisphosphate aldolase class II